MLLLLAAAAPLHVDVEAYDGLDLTTSGTEREMSVSVTRTCPPGAVFLEPMAGEVMLDGLGQGVHFVPARIQFPHQVCSLASSMMLYGSVHANASAGSDTGTWNATAWVQSQHLMGEAPFVVTITPEGQHHPVADGTEEEPDTGAITVTDKARRAATLFAGVGIAIGFVLGPRTGRGWRHPRMKVRIVEA